MSASRRIASLSAALLLTSCDNPTRPLAVPTVESLGVFLILDPDSSTQAIVVRQQGGRPLIDLHAFIRTGGVLAAQSDSPAPDSATSYSREIEPCLRRYGGDWLGWTLRCVSVPFTPAYGATYSMEVTSLNRPTVAGTTTVPGAFAIVSHHVSGPMPGDVMLDATWTSSPGVYRYVVAVRGGIDTRGGPSCYPNVGCYSLWHVVTQDTTITARVGATTFEGSSSPFELVVYAMNRAVFEYMMTGSTSDFFPVPPAQNATGGHGAIGAWVQRAVPIP